MTKQQVKDFFRTVFKVVAGGPAVGTPGANRSAGTLAALDLLAERAIEFEPILADQFGTGHPAAGNLMESLAFLYTHLGSGTLANQAPSVTINGSATGTVGTQQRFQAVASDSDGTVAKVELCLMANATSLLTYTVLDMDPASPFVLDWTPTAAGNFILRMRATDDKGATSFSSALAVQVANATSPPTATLVPTHAHYNSSHSSDYLGTVPLPAAYALLPFTVPAGATQATVTYRNTLGPYAYLTLHNASGNLADYPLAATSATTSATVTIALPGTGARRFWLQLPRQQHDAATYDLLGAGIASITFDNGGLGSFYTLPKKALGVYVLGDSIFSQAGDQPADAPYFSLAPTFRRNGVDVCLNAAGGRRLRGLLDTPAKRTAEVARAVAFLGDYALQDVLREALINDYGQGYDPVELAGFLYLFYQELTQALPNARLVDLSILTNGYGNNPNQGGLGGPYPTSAYDQALQTEVYAKRPDIVAVDGKTLLPNNAQYLSGDAVHPTKLGTVYMLGQIYPYLFAASSVVGVGEYVDETAVNKTGNWLPYVTADALGGSRIYTDAYVSATARSQKPLKGGLFEGYAVPQIGHHYDVYLIDAVTGVRKRYLEVKDSQTTKPTIVPPDATRAYFLEVVAVGAYGQPGNFGQAVWDAWFVRDNVNGLPPTPELPDAYVAGDHVEQDAFLNTGTMLVNNQAGSGGSRIYTDNVDLTTTLNKQFKAATVLFNSGDFGPGWKFDVDVLPADGSPTYTVTLADGDAHEGLVNNPYASQYCTLKARCVKAYSQGAGTSTGALVLDCVDFS